MAGLVTPTGWGSIASGIFNDIGSIASSIKNFATKKTAAQSAAQAAADKAQAAAINQAKLNATKAQTSKVKALSILENVKSFFSSHWYLFAIGGGIIIIFFLRHQLEGLFDIDTRKNKTPRRSSLRKRRASTTKTKTKSKSRGARTSRSSSGFRKKIHGKLYTSKRAWAAEMQRLRKKKR